MICPFRTVETITSSFPASFRSRRVVLSLMTTLGHGGSTTSALLPVAFKLARSLPVSDYLSIVVFPAVRLFANQDRAVRMVLLDALPEFIDKVETKLVSEQIWPHLHGGFADTVPVLREATVRSILHIYPKLSDRILNNELLRHLAKTQADPEASIRTNTCILIGRLAPFLNANTRRKVLAPAFAKAMKDSFVHARLAGLAAFLANTECFEPEDIALKVLPIVVTTLIDQEK
jgi:SCY1-like protein 1